MDKKYPQTEGINHSICGYFEKKPIGKALFRLFFQIAYGLTDSGD